MHLLNYDFCEKHYLIRDNVLKSALKFCVAFSNGKHCYFLLLSATNSAPEVVKKEKAIVLTMALSQLGTGMCVDGRAAPGKAMNQPWRNSWSDRETSIAEGAMNRSPRGCGSFML